MTRPPRLGPQPRIACVWRPAACRRSLWKFPVGGKRYGEMDRESGCSKSEARRRRLPNPPRQRSAPFPAAVRVSRSVAASGGPRSPASTPPPRVLGRGHQFWRRSPNCGGASSRWLALPPSRLADSRRRWRTPAVRLSDWPAGPSGQRQRRLVRGAAGVPAASAWPPRPGAVPVCRRRHDRRGSRARVARPLLRDIPPVESRHHSSRTPADIVATIPGASAASAATVLDRSGVPNRKGRRT